MSTLKIHTPLLNSAIANPQAVFQYTKTRITLLTERLVRVECSENGLFEDRPSQVFWYRNQPVPPAEILQAAQSLSIETNFFKLTYQDSNHGCTRESFQVLLKKSGRTVHLDDPNPGLLPGTARTLDEADGAIPLQPGVLSRSGWVQINDTQSLIFNTNGWLEPRLHQKGYRDLYFLICEQNYKAALQDYQKIAGTPPLLPRAFLGNWWSRYWAYTQTDIQHLVERFEQEKIPLSTYIIDMDWHITETGNTSTGWTGFSWNHDLLPDPPGLLKWLHDRGLKTALNLHPAEGIHPHEAQYTAVAKAMGVDPKTKQPIPFDIADPLFAQTYFDKVLHPLEDQGVDFWWLDWQQGEITKLPGLDPLWWLNHIHFYDLGRDSDKRAVIFSRWGGPGNHRYPIGFSGDSVITWESLAFQPYFTAAAANTAYGWWSHDIGGHMFGMEDRERYVRWVQFGVISPIFRLHSTKDQFVDRHPWGFDAEVLRLARSAMQFRHALIPYLYTMSRRNEQEGIPLITPLFYDWPAEESAYVNPNQYLFGTELMAAPVCSAADPETGKARQGIWFPPGEWFEFFNSKHHTGGRWEIDYFDLADIPLYAKAGGIIPLQTETTHNGVDNPASIDLMVFPGGDGTFTLYEDDGASQEYLQGVNAQTIYHSQYTGNRMSVTISAVSGDRTCLPAKRTYRILFRGITQPERISAVLDGKPLQIQMDYDIATRTVFTTPVQVQSDQQLVVEISTKQDTLLANNPTLESEVIDFLKGARIPSLSKWKISTIVEELKSDLKKLIHPQIQLTDNQKVALIEMITGAGGITVLHPEHGKQVVLLNPDQLSDFKCKGLKTGYIDPQGSVISEPKEEIQLDYFGLVKKKL